MIDPAQLRKDFPALDQQVNGHPLVYLDNAATTQKPLAVINALDHYYRRDNSNVHRGLHELSNRATAAYEHARVRAAQFVNAADADEIVFTRGTTEGLNLIANTWGAVNISAGDEILLTEAEHHSNLIPWQLLAQRAGARLRFVPVRSGADGDTLDLDALEKLLAPPVKLFSFVHVSNTLALVNNAKKFCALARQRGIVSVIDAAQSIGHRPLDVRDLGCDFLSVSGHKMAGPTGIGFLYGRKELLEQLPPWQGGGEMLDSTTYETAKFKPAPHRFEAGTPNIADAIALSAAMDYLDAVGRDAIADHDARLSAYAYEKLGALDFLRILGPKSGRAGLTTFVMSGVHAHDVVEMANIFGIALRGGHHCNQPLMKKLNAPASARASFYLYNTAAEVDRLAETLVKIKQYFTR
ncbi:MAG: cysteine desulfurase [Verrucomicrobiales bacterium]|jgi:cysteine desulfurase/selenocysteine lyase|nr:cysteine desulfurase [Verrucomicrobiales bacterium]